MVSSVVCAYTHDRMSADESASQGHGNSHMLLCMQPPRFLGSFCHIQWRPDGSWALKAGPGSILALRAGTTNGRNMLVNM